MKIPVGEHNHALGEHHHRARYSDEFVELLRRLNREEGLGVIKLHRLYPHVPKETIRAFLLMRRRATIVRGWRDDGS